MSEQMRIAEDVRKDFALRSVGATHVDPGAYKEDEMDGAQALIRTLESLGVEAQGLR